MPTIYQQIGAEILSSLGDNMHKVLLYSEVEDGVISADLFFQPSSNHSVSFRFAPDSIKSLIYTFWSSGEESVQPNSWRILQYIVENGKFAVDLSYPDQLDHSEDLSDRRPRALANHFPGAKVDYSKPNG